MAFVPTLMRWLHDIPHLSLRFKPIQETFNLDINGHYVQSLVVLSGISLALALLLLLIIVITWICQCCLRKSNTVRSRRRVRQLSTVLFILSVICFLLLGTCLYGNDHINKGVNSAVAGLSDVNHNVKLAVAQ
ncbi:Protein TTYH-1 c, partial [Aphelenchoides avenae]